MQESERLAGTTTTMQFDLSPQSSSMKHQNQQAQITSQNNMQNYDSLLYSEITENNETLLNTPQHPLKLKNPLLKNTQQNDSGQVSERQLIQQQQQQQQSTNANHFGNTNNNSQRNQQQQQQYILQSSADKQGQNTNNSNRGGSQNESNQNSQRQGVGVVVADKSQSNRKKNSPQMVHEFQIYTEEDEEQQEEEEVKQNIERMDMSGNMLQKIQKLDNFKQLIFLNLSYNRIQVIENINMLVNLQYLNLSNNLIKQIPVSINKNTHLQHLLLSTNGISSIESLANLQPLSSLKELNLLDNPIQSLSEYKVYIKNNLKQVLLLDQKNVHISNLNSVGESWNSQLSFSNNNASNNNHVSVTQSAHFQKKVNSNKQSLLPMQNPLQNLQNIQNVHPIQGLVESFQNNQMQHLQNRQNHIYSFGSQQNDTPTNQLFGFELNLDNQQLQKMKKPHSLDLQYLSMQNMQNAQQQLQSEQYFNHMGELNRSITEIETDLDSDGNVIDKQFQEQRLYYSNTKSAKKNFQAFLEQQKQIQLHQQFLASPQGNEGSIIMFENSPSNENHQKSVWQNPLANTDQTFSESANKNSFLDSKISPSRQNTTNNLGLPQDNIVQQISEKPKSRSQDNSKSQDFNYSQSTAQNVLEGQKPEEQNSYGFRRNLKFEEQMNENLLPHLSEEEAYRLKRCLFQQNNDQIDFLSKMKFQGKKDDIPQQPNNVKEDAFDEEINLTNLHSISNYFQDQSTAKKFNEAMQQQMYQPQQNNNQILSHPPQPTQHLQTVIPVPGKEEVVHVSGQKEKQQRVTPFIDFIGISNSEPKLTEQSMNQLNNASQLQSLFDNIESHRGDFLIQDFTQIYTASKMGSGNNPQTPQNNMELFSPAEESAINSNILNSEKQCKSVANTLQTLAEQLKSLHDSFQEYKHRIDETAEKSNSLIQKIAKCTDDCQKESIKEKEKLVKDILGFKNDISSSFEQSNIFIAEFGLQINKFMKEIQVNSENKTEFIINDALVPRIPSVTVKNVKDLFDKIQDQNNELFISANKMTEEISKSKFVQKDFLVEKLNQHVENLITLFKEISNLHLTCCDTFESIEHTSERLTKYFIHIVRLLQAKQVIQFSNHKRNPSNQSNISSNPSKPISTNNLSKDFTQASSKLNRQQSSKDFNLPNTQLPFCQQNSPSQQISISQLQLQQQQQQIQLQQQNQQQYQQQQFNLQIQQQQQLLALQQQQLLMKQINEKDSKTPKSALSNLTMITQEGYSEEEQKRFMNSNIEQIQAQMQDYRKEIQNQHFKNQKSEELRLEELDPTLRMNLLSQNIQNANLQSHMLQNAQNLMQKQQQQTTPILTPNNNDNNPIKSNLPISPNSTHLNIASPNTQLNQLKSNAQSSLLRSSKHQQELEVLKFKFSDFEKTSLQRYDSLLKTKEQVEKDYNQIMQNYSELQSNYENLLQKYSGIQQKYEEELAARERENHEIEREEFLSQISSLKLRVSDLEKHVNSSENQKQLLMKDKQILKDQISVIQKDYQNLEKTHSVHVQQNQKLLETNRELNSQNQQLNSGLNNAENTIVSMKQLLTARLSPMQAQKGEEQEGEFVFNSSLERQQQYSHKKSLSQQYTISNQGLNQQQQQNGELNSLLENILQNVSINMQQNNQIIQMLSLKEARSNSALQEEQLLNNNIQTNINESNIQEENHQEWSEMLKMQVKQKQLLYKQIQAMTAIISSVKTNNDANLQECIKRITSLQDTVCQSTQTDPSSLTNTHYQFFDSMISPPSKTSTVITQITNQNNTNLSNNNNQINNQNSTQHGTSNTQTLEDSNTKSNIMTSTTMTLPNILESVRKHQHNVLQAKMKSNTTGNSSSTASEKLYKLAAQRCEEETAKNMKNNLNQQQIQQQQDKWFNNSPDRYCGTQSNQNNEIQSEGNSEDPNHSSSQHSSSNQNKSLQKSRQLLKQMTDNAKIKKEFITEDSSLQQTKKKTSNEHSHLLHHHTLQGDQNTVNGGKKNLNKTVSELQSQMERKTIRNHQNINSNVNQTTNLSMTHQQQDFILNNTMQNEKPKRDTSKSPTTALHTKELQKDIHYNNMPLHQQHLINNFLKKDYKYPTKSNQTNVSNQSIQYTNKTQQSQNQSASVINPTMLNSNSNNPNNTSTISHYKSNSNLPDKSQAEHSKNKKNCLKSVINAYKNIQTLRKMQDFLKNDENLTTFLNKTASHIPVNQSFNGNTHKSAISLAQQQQQQQQQLKEQHQSQVSSNVNQNINNSQLTKFLKKATRSQSNLGAQNGNKSQNPININLFSQLMNINCSVSSARQKSANFKSTRNINEKQTDFNAINLYNSAKQQQQLQNSGSSSSKMAKKKKKSSSQQMKVMIKQNNEPADQNTTNVSNFFNNHNNTLNNNTNNTNTNNITTDNLNNSQMQNTSNLNNTITTFSNGHTTNAHITPSHTKSVSSILASLYQQPNQVQKGQEQNTLQPQQLLQHQQQQLLETQMKSPTVNFNQNTSRQQQGIYPNGESPYLVQDILTANQQLSNQSISKQASQVVVLPTSTQVQKSVTETMFFQNQINNNNINNVQKSFEFPNKKKTSFKSHLEDLKMNEQLSGNSTGQFNKNPINNSTENLNVQRNLYQ